MDQVFLLSPARCDGARARLLLNPGATFDLAERLRAREGAPLGEVFSFLSGLYFRGKLAYAGAFAHRADSTSGSWIITTDRGLAPPDQRVTREDLVAFSGVDLATADERYVTPLRRDAERLANSIGQRTRIVLLGSIATGKYADILMQVFEDRLVFPTDFVGRGDMSRGGLLLRRVREGRELEYQPVIGAIRHGKRPPKLGRPL
jgi:hypothetical protein